MESSNEKNFREIFLGDKKKFVLVFSMMCLLSSVLHQFIRSPNLSFYSAAHLLFR
jgi:hypothetical protein